MNNKLIQTIGYLAIATVAAFAIFSSGCSPRREYPVTFWGTPPDQLLSQVMTHSVLVRGIYSQVSGHSMEPTLMAGDYVIIDNKATFADVHEGVMAVYKARWLTKAAPLVIHWATSKSGKDFIMDGENNKHYEGGKIGGMGKEEFEYVDADGIRRTGKVIAIYTTRPKPSRVP